MANSIFEEKNCLLYRKHENLSFEEYLKQVSKDYEGFIFKTIDRDAVGNSGGHPRWGNVFKYENGQISDSSRIAIYKEPDYDEPNGPYAEKLWSILGKLILPNCKIPDIDIIRDEKYPEIPGVISYSIVNKEKEDMTDIRTILRYNSITEAEMKKNDDRLYIEELLGYVKTFIGEEGNYKEIEEQIIKTILLDCITNSFDRHPDNWALVCDNETRKYTLGLYDNTASFVNMISTRSGVVNNENWGKVFIKVKNKENKDTDMGNEVIKYISKKYPIYFKEFVESLENNLDKFYEIIGQVKYRDVIKYLNRRKSYLKCLNIEDREFGD